MISGFINVYKPSGEYSGKSVGRVKAFLRHLGYRDISVGHMGTLDPLAEGVLPVAIGRATRLFDYMLDKDKCYEACYELGYETTTLDAMGEVTMSGGATEFSLREIDTACSTLVGDIDQIPPMYSAKSIDGERAYDLARRGESITLKSKRVRIDEVSPYTIEGKNYLSIRCGGGTYVRSIIRDLGYALGTYATMTALRRTQSGVFYVGDSVDIRDFNTIDASIILPTEYALGAYPKIEIDDERDRLHLTNGISIPTTANDGIYTVYYDDILQGIASVSQHKITFKTRLI